MATELTDAIEASTPLNQQEDDTEIKENEEEEAGGGILHSRSETLIVEHKRKEAWLNIAIDVQSISTVDQTFGVHTWINVFWLDVAFINTQFRQQYKGDEVISFDYDGFIEKFPGYRLPLNVNKLFLNALETTKSPKDDWKIWINPQTKDLHIFLEFEGQLMEHLETADFPFDAQFLNLKLWYDMSNYNFITKCPDWVYFASHFNYHLPIFVTKFSTIVQWDMLTPWIDMRKKKDYFDINNLDLTEAQKEKIEPPVFDYGLIKLRVRRNPMYYFLYTVFPAILITLTSFAASAIPAEDIGDRLGYLVTLLLTVAAFQYAISEVLPDSPELTNVDKFILFGYFIECLFILYVSVSGILSHDPDTQDIFEIVVPCVLAAIWIVAVIRYVIIPVIEYRKGVNWEEMSDEEYFEFDYNNEENDNVLPMGEGCVFYGSGGKDHVDGGIVVEKKRNIYTVYDVNRIADKRFVNFDVLEGGKGYDENKKNHYITPVLEMNKMTPGATKGK